jgi:hypothetical protein
MRVFSSWKIRADTHAKSNKLEGIYNPAVNSCVTLRTHRLLVNAIGVLVVDVVLLLTMLIGLLRHPHKSSTGMWKFLYQQVTVIHPVPSYAGRSHPTSV